LSPTSIQFTRAFKKLFSMKVLQHTDTQNCAEDTDDMLNLIGASCSSPSLFSISIPTRPVLDIPNHDYYII